MTDGKQVLREQAVAARARMTPAARADLSRVIGERVAALPAFSAARVVALYHALGSEVDPAPVARVAAAAGKRLAYPLLLEGERALAFACCEPPDLVPGPLRTRQPPAALARLDLAELDLVLVPGLAFDAAGRRLGRGRGHYDATLARLPRRAVRVGLAFEVQIVPAVPEEPHDVRLDLVVTELRTLPAEPGAAVAG